jgi:hypothetical protein
MKLIWLSMIMIIFVSSIGIAKAEIDITTNSTIFMKGEEVKVFGFIPDHLFDEPNGYDVIMRVYEPQFGNLVDIRQITPIDGTFSTIFKSESTLWKHYGIYQIFVNHAGDESTSEFLLVVG